MKKINEDFIIGKLHVRLDYYEIKGITAQDITVQEKDGTVLFNGTRNKASELLEVLQEVLK